MSKPKKLKQGGYREGSGRLHRESTVVKRIPLSIVAAVDQLIAQARIKFEEKNKK